MCGKRSVEVTGPEALRIVVDSDDGMQRRIFAPLAKYLAVDVASGADDRPAVLFGQYHRLFLERDDRHQNSPVRPPLFLGACSASVVTLVGVRRSPFSPCPGDGDICDPIRTPPP